MQTDMNQGTPVKKFDQPTKRYVQILDITNDAELIRKYCHCHSQEVFWPEIQEGQKIGTRLWPNLPSCHAKPNGRPSSLPIRVVIQMPRATRSGR